MTNPHDHRVAGAAIAVLKQQLAAEQACSAQLRDGLEKIACLGNGDQHGNSVGNCMAIDLLGIPHDDTALMEWGARLLEKIANHDIDVTSRGLRALAKQLRSGEWKP
jgi:hypothetical protein